MQLEVAQIPLNMRTGTTGPRPWASASRQQPGQATQTAAKQLITSCW